MLHIILHTLLIMMLIVTIAIGIASFILIRHLQRNPALTVFLVNILRQLWG